MKSSFLPKYERKFFRISALHTLQGRNPDNFVHILGEMMTSKIHSEIYRPLENAIKNLFLKTFIILCKKILNIPQLCMNMFSLKAFSHEFFMNSFLESLPSWHTIQRKYVSFRSTIEFVFTFQAPKVESFYSVKLWILFLHVSKSQ